MSDILTRMVELWNLDDGWLDGDGVAPSTEGLDWFVDAFEEHEELELPFIFPTPGGGIECNWTFGPHDVTFEINLDTHQGFWHCLNHETLNDESRDLNLDDSASWAWIGEKLADYERDAK